MTSVRLKPKPMLPGCCVVSIDGGPLENIELALRTFKRKCQREGRLKCVSRKEQRVHQTRGEKSRAKHGRHLKRSRR